VFSDCAESLFDGEREVEKEEENEEDDAEEASDGGLLGGSSSSPLLASVASKDKEAESGSEMESTSFGKRSSLRDLSSSSLSSLESG